MNDVITCIICPIGCKIMVKKDRDKVEIVGGNKCKRGEVYAKDEALFLYEKNDSLILGAGIDEKWLDRKEGISVKNMPTYFGKISYSMQKKNNVLKIKVTGSAKPRKGFVLKSPFLHKKIKSVSVNSRKWERFSDDEVLFDKLPAEIVIVY